MWSIWQMPKLMGIGHETGLNANVRLCWWKRGDKPGSALEQAPNCDDVETVDYQRLEVRKWWFIWKPQHRVCILYVDHSGILLHFFFANDGAVGWSARRLCAQKPKELQKAVPNIDLHSILLIGRYFTCDVFQGCLSCYYSYSMAVLQMSEH